MFGFSKEVQTKIMAVCAGVLIAALIALSGPVALVHAEEGGEGGESTPAAEESVQTESSGGSEEQASEPGPQVQEQIEEATESQEETAQTASEESEQNTEQNQNEEENTDGEDGAAGESGDAGNTQEGGGDTVVETGDASVQGEIGNSVNTTTTNTNEEETASTTPNNAAQEDEQASSTPQYGPTGGWGNDGVTASTTISVDNEADVDNDLTVDAETGDNTATTTDGTAIINTGDALAAANVINVVNSTITNSNGFLLLLNALFGDGAFDLRDFDFGWEASTPTYQSLGGTQTSSACSFGGCDSADTNLTVTASSTATIKNDVVVRAQTGGNTASGGNALIQTGDAYAGANVVNLANTNIIDSNYLLVAINNLGDLNEDIVFPGLEFFKQFFTSGTAAPVANSMDISSTSTANIANNITATADTGNNTASSTSESDSADQSVIVTGDASADSNAVNIANTNLFGGNSLLILLRIHGDWSGDIFGLPEGILWEETPFGIQLYSDPNAGGENSGAPQYQSLVSTNTNEATIENNIEVYALTGENKAEGANTGIVTGDAVAGANVVNMVNTNVIGQNWILAIFNIFGDWNGNLAFGRPDLWLGARAESPDNPIRPGSPVTLHYTVTNFGDSRATDVILGNHFDQNLLALKDATLEMEGGLGFELGDFAPGETKEFTVEGIFGAAQRFAFGETPLALTAEVTSTETDNNDEDNSEELGFSIFREGSSGGSGSVSGGGSGGGSSSPTLIITKTANVSETRAPGIVEYTIVITNYGGNAYNAVLHDVLTDSEGVIVTEQQWGLDTIYANEEITVTYEIEFEGDTETGEYTNTAYVDATTNKSGTRKANSKEKELTIMVTGNGPQFCEAYLTSYIRRGSSNDSSQVLRLQRFLNEYEGLEVPLTGFYDSTTEQAVRDFQEKYRSSILTPWGIGEPTGYVYYTTQKQVNDIYCGGERVFPLSENQLNEIESFKTRIERSIETGEPIDVDTSTVGFEDGDAMQIAREEQSGSDLVAGAGAAVGDEGPSFLRRVFNSIRDRFIPWVFGERRERDLSRN